MKKAFNRKAGNTADIRVLQRQFDPHVDGYLLLGRIKGESRYFVGWQSRHREDIVDGRGFATESEANSYFDDMLANDERSDHKVFHKDYQVRAVYDWEDDELLPLSRDLDRTESRNLIREACAAFDVPGAKLIWEKVSHASSYSDGVIYLGTRDNISLLHEIAHHIHENRVIGDEDLAPHSPGFVAFAIALYGRFAGIDMDFLIQSARSKEILGELDDISIIVKPYDDRQTPTKQPRTGRPQLGGAGPQASP